RRRRELIRRPGARGQERERCEYQQEPRAAEEVLHAALPSSSWRRGESPPPPPIRPAAVSLECPRLADLTGKSLIRRGRGSRFVGNGCPSPEDGSARTTIGGRTDEARNSEGAAWLDGGR